MEIFGNYNFEDLINKGYKSIGKPALLVKHPRHVTIEQLTDSIKKTNGNITYDAIAHYWKTDADYDAPNPNEHTQIVGSAGGIHLLIVQALRRI